MQAALLRTLDGPAAIRIEDIPEPVAAAGEVVVRVRAVGLNFLDTLITRGRYQYKPPLPFSPGAEIAGEVMSLGPGVSGVRVGQRVCGYTGWGGARERIAVKAEMLTLVPDAVSNEAAAAVTITYGTAIHGLRDRGRLGAGETVAVLGAAGGAGLAAVEVAKAMGAKVIAVASSADKLAVCARSGADLLLNYTDTDLKAGLRDLTGGRGPDVIYDCVGGPHAEAALRSIAWLGRFLVVGFAAGDIPRIPLNLLLLKSCDMAGVFWGEMASREPARQAANMRDVLGWIAAGRLTPHVSAVHPLADIAKAIGSLDDRTATGKVVVRV